MSVKAVLFDDWESYFHTIAGLLTPFFPNLSVIFLTYELAEYEVKRDHFIGDLCEYSLGLFLYYTVLVFARLVRVI